MWTEKVWLAQGQPANFMAKGLTPCDTLSSKHRAPSSFLNFNFQVCRGLILIRNTQRDERRFKISPQTPGLYLLYNLKWPQGNIQVLVWAPVYLPQWGKQWQFQIGKSL